MRGLPAAVGWLIVLSGCAGQQAPDNTGLFVRCLKESGGRQISAPAQLAGYTPADARPGVGAALESVSYFTIEIGAGHGGRRRALVFVETPRDEPASVPLPEPAELLRRARNGEAAVRALVLMRRAKDVEAPIGRCRETAAPGQITP